MKLFKFPKWNFCDKIFSIPKFASTKKEKFCLERQGKISILEYFDIIEKRTYAKSEEALLKELILYLNSENFSKEFKYSLSNENRIFKFFILNLSLINHRLMELRNEKFKQNFKENKPFLKINFLEFFQILKLRLMFNYFPLNYIYDEFYNHYAKKYILKDTFKEFFLEKFLKKFKMLDLKYLKFRDSFSKELNNLDFKIELFINDERNNQKNIDDLLREDKVFNEKYENFLKKYFLHFIFDTKIKNSISENKNDDYLLYINDVNKLFTYFTAHVFKYI